MRAFLEAIAGARHGDNGGRSILFIDGVPLPVILHRMNVRHGLPMAPKMRRNAEGDRAKAKARGREFARMEHAEQKDWEQHFRAAMGWTWRKVEQEIRARGWTFGKLRELAMQTSLAAA